MKHLYAKLLSLTLLLPLVSGAQTITRANLPAVGEQYEAVFVGNYGIFGSWTSGHDQVWDFSTWAASNSGDTVIFDYQSVPGTSPFAGSEMTVGIPGLGSLYFTSSQSVYSLSGMSTSYSGTTVDIPYSDVQELIRFPFTYNDSFTDNASGTFTESGFTFNRTVNSETVADGSGTLISPDATYNNVLRLKITSQITDAGIITNNSSTEEYLWISEDFKHQLAYAIKVTNGTTVTEMVFYFTNPVNLNPTTGTVNAYNNSIELYPNPASDQVSVKGLSSAAGSELVLYSVSGEKVASVPANAETFALPADLETGLYFYSLQQNGEVIRTGKISIR